MAAAVSDVPKKYLPESLKFILFENLYLKKQKDPATLAESFSFQAESEGFEPPVPRRVQQISSLPRSTTPATLRLDAQKSKKNLIYRNGSWFFCVFPKKRFLCRKTSWAKPSFQ